MPRKNDQPTYFAVPDPDTGDMTYWYRTTRGAIEPWPPREGKYGPRLLARDIEGLSAKDREAAVRTWSLTLRIPWDRQVRAALDADLDAAAARFAAFTSRCCICGRPLTDEKSKVLGIGPDCRTGIPTGVLEEFAREMGRIHGQAPEAAATNETA